MSVDKVFQSAQRQKPIGQYIPPGIKENVFFVIDDTYNYQRRLSKKQSEYHSEMVFERDGPLYSTNL
jgi:hypothetical protein